MSKILTIFLYDVVKSYKNLTGSHKIKFFLQASYRINIFLKTIFVSSFLVSAMNKWIHMNMHKNQRLNVLHFNFQNWFVNLIQLVTSYNPKNYYLFQHIG